MQEPLAWVCLFLACVIIVAGLIIRGQRREIDSGQEAIRVLEASVKSQQMYIGDLNRLLETASKNDNRDPESGRYV